MMAEAIEQHGLPLWDGESESPAYQPLFAVDERVGYRADESWRGTVVQVAHDRVSARNHFWVVWTIGQPGGPHEYTAGTLYRLPEPTAAERRRERQGKYLAAGLHPLSAAMRRSIPLHPEAAPAANPDAPGRRCGNCRFRELMVWHDSTYPKCGFAGRARMTHGPGTDTRAWWPACSDHQPREVG